MDSTDKINIKVYNLNISQNSKDSWEREEILNPRFSLRGIDIKNLSIDETEDFIINSIKSSFSELRKVISEDEFTEAKIILPSLQMCSDQSVIDFGINIIESIEDEVDDIGSDWDHPSEMWEDFAKMNGDDVNEVVENELDIIKRSIDGNGTS